MVVVSTRMQHVAVAGIEDASRTLWSQYRGAPWFTSVGIATDASGSYLILYVKQVTEDARRLAMTGWAGFRVRVKRMSGPRPLQG